MATFSLDPFTNIDTLTRGLLDIASPVGAGGSRSPRFMPMDLYRLDDHYVLTADLPGMDPGSIDVDFDNGTLTITAQRSGVVDGRDNSASSADDAGPAVEWLVNERFAGSYRRQVTIGDSVDPGAVTASYDNGVLTVTMPLAEQAKSRKIAIDHGAGRKEITA
ncbi:Hsp20/alpha crystallin family protein [Corynebacterium sp.]|uniref:Hsp20/alpha crystallin family protein n=1 Tax=Corynebacterium sp. TaxID=1720 RepID=UPI0025B7EE80|nr:Hsp20/alpha crystallin family protein [Corynebacterium sp.]